MRYHKPKTYLVPGPVTVPMNIRKVYQRDFGAGMLEPEFLKLYAATQKAWQKILHTNNKIAFMTGEPMVGLWGGLNSCLKKGDKVLSIANGLFSSGIGEMAKTIGAHVQFVHIPYNQATNDYAGIESAIKAFQPKMITAVHCETPTGMLNPLAQIGALKKKHKIPLFYVDAVASIAGAPVDVDRWNIDICIGGGQKAPAVFPDITLLAISDMAWKIIEQVNYAGYDALKPWHNILENRAVPYTPHWHGVAALYESAKNLQAEGLKQVFARHEVVAKFCRDEIKKMGLELWVQDETYASPTVTAIKVPTDCNWQKLDQKLRKQGVLLGDCYAELRGNIFRIGHMGSQADLKLVKQALAILKRSL